MTQSKEQVEIINQAVDTYKEHYYPSELLLQPECVDYNDFVYDLITLKKEAQEINSKNGDERYITHYIDNNKFHVMSTTQKGFAVTVKNNDVSISFKRFKKISKQPCIKIEYRAEYLARYGYVKCVNQVEKLLKTVLPSFYKVASELHLCTDVQGYDFSIMDFFRIKTRARKKEIFTEADTSAYFDGMKFTGFSIGSGDFMIRIYNKSHEIKKKPEKAFVKPSRWLWNPNFNEEQEVWRIEVQIRREKLKSLFNGHKMMDDSINCLNSLPDVWTLFMDKYKHKNLSDDCVIEIMKGKKTYKNGKEKLLSKYAIRKRFKESPDSNIWSKINKFWETKGRNLTYQEEIKKPSSLYVKNSIKSLVSTLTKHMGGVFDMNALNDIVSDMQEEHKQQHNITVFDSARIKAIESFNKVKVYYEQNYKNGVVLADEFKLYEQNLEHNLINLFSNLLGTESISHETLTTINKKLGFEPTQERKQYEFERSLNAC